MVETGAGAGSGVRGRGGRGRGRGGQKEPAPSKEDLDAELDAYRQVSFCLEILVHVTICSSPTEH